MIVFLTHRTAFCKRLFKNKNSRTTRSTVAQKKGEHPHPVLCTMPNAKHCAIKRFPARSARVRSLGSRPGLKNSCEWFSYTKVIRAVFTWLSEGIGFGFGFGFTTPFGWLVYLLWFWFYDSQVKTALSFSLCLYKYLTHFCRLFYEMISGWRRLHRKTANKLCELITCMKRCMTKIQRAKYSCLLTFLWWSHRNCVQQLLQAVSCFMIQGLQGNLWVSKNSPTYTIHESASIRNHVILNG